MADIEIWVEIAKPVEEVFAFIADVENDLKWRSGIIELRRTEGAPGQVGSRYRQVIKPTGSPIDADIEITAVEPNRLMTFKTVSDNAVKPTGTWRLERAGSQTRLGFFMDLEARGLRVRLMLPVIRSGMRDTLQKNLRKLKELLEAPPSGSAG